MTDEYARNVLIEIEAALANGANGVTLSRRQCEQLLREFAILVEKNNELLRGVDKTEPTSIH